VRSPLHMHTPTLLTRGRGEGRTGKEEGSEEGSKVGERKKVRTDRHTTQRERERERERETHSLTLRRSKFATTETKKPTCTLTDIKTDTKDGLGSFNKNYTGLGIIKHACSTSFAESTHMRVHVLCSMLGCSSPANTYARMLWVAHTPSKLYRVYARIFVLI